MSTDTPAPPPVDVAAPLDLDAVVARAKRAQKEISDLCHGRRRWTMSVPVDLSRDSDIVLSDSVCDALKLAIEVRDLRARLAWINDGTVELDHNRKWRASFDKVTYTGPEFASVDDALDYAARALASTARGAGEAVRCDDCSRTDKHTHCPECGSTEHVASTCDMEG